MGKKFLCGCAWAASVVVGVVVGTNLGYEAAKLEKNQEIK